MHSTKTGRAARRWVRGALAGFLAVALPACGGEPEQVLALTLWGSEGGAVGSTLHLDAVAIYSDSQWKYVADEADWVSSATTVARIDGPAAGYAGARVNITAVGPGEAVITATYLGVSASQTLTVW
jgi:hypothetical protein